MNGGPIDAPPPAPPAAGAPPPVRRVEPVVPPDALRDRLRRAGSVAADAEKRKWMKLLGTDDPTKVAEKLQKLADLEKQEQERATAQMTELQKLQAERDTEKARAEQLAADLEETRSTMAYQRQDQELREIASQFLDAKAVKFARHEWASYVVTLSPEEQEKLSVRDARKWFQKFATENPHFAKAEPGAAAPPAPAAAASVPPRGAPGAPPARRPPPPPVGAVRKPATNGAAPPKKEPAPSTQPGNDPSVDSGKTARPGQKNSMNRQELKAFAASKGINYPG